MTSRYGSADNKSKGRLVTVYHVGNLTQSRSGRFSQEGGELSVSTCPREWIYVARLNADKYYKMTKRGAKFLQVRGNVPSKKVLQWAVEKGYIKLVERYRVSHGFDEELGDETFSDYDTFKEAEEEAQYRQDEEGIDVEVEAFQGYGFAVKGVDYWHNSFDKRPVENGWADSFAAIFYARACGYDGVWWNNTYDPLVYSLPRGCILQEKISTWTIEEIDYEDLPYERDV